MITETKREMPGGGRKIAAHAVALKVALPRIEGELTVGERTLLDELLARITDSVR